MDPAAEGFRLDKTPLNALNPLQAAHVANAFTLNSSSNGRLNNDRLYPVGPGMVWLDITQWITSIRTSQSQQDTADMAPDAGSCEIRFLNAPDFGTLPASAGRGRAPQGPTRSWPKPKPAARPMPRVEPVMRMVWVMMGFL